MDQGPSDVVAVASEVIPYMLAGRLRQGLPPAQAGVVIVSAGIDHAVSRVLVWQVARASVLLRAERELQHPHAGQAMALA